MSAPTNPPPERVVAQVNALKTLIARGGSMSVAELRPIHNSAFPEPPLNYPFESWLSFPKHSSLIEWQGEGVQITRLGRALPPCRDGGQYSPFLSN
jgi:hypothetical protein